MNWQPIETAPKDGSEILTIDQWGKYAVAEWIEARELWFAGEDDVSPTHWMPLPDPPEQTVNVKTNVKTG